MMQFKYDPVDGHCYFLRMQTAFNILEIAEQLEWLYA